jgi:hypothetical protein
MGRRAKEWGLILVAGGLLAIETAGLLAVLPGVTRAVVSSGIPAVAALPATAERPGVMVEFVRTECVVKTATRARRVRHEVRETVLSTLREAVL